MYDRIPITDDITRYMTTGHYFYLLNKGNAVNFLQLRETADPDLLWCRGIIERQTNQLTRLVDDLLDVSRISLGKIKLQVEVLDLATVVHRALETSRPMIDERRHQLSVQVPAEPVRVAGDRARLTQVIANLLNNAAKFQREGGTIEVTVERNGTEGVVVVRDTGVGIAPEKLSEIFELFAQGDPETDQAQSGLGIGLSLVRTVVELHGGRVSAESTGLGQGSRFTIRLPRLAAVESSVRSPEESAPAPVECPPLRVLVVDDNRDAAESLTRLLELGGHTVRLAHEGQEALRLAAAELPAVVLLDIGLPGMDGYEICRRLRRNGLSGTLIVAMTGYGQGRDRVLARDAGFDTHLVKPVHPTDLLKLMAAHARAPRGQVPVIG